MKCTQCESIFDKKVTVQLLCKSNIASKCYAKLFEKVHLYVSVKWKGYLTG